MLSKAPRYRRMVSACASSRYQAHFFEEVRPGIEALCFTEHNTMLSKVPVSGDYVAHACMHKQSIPGPSSVWPGIEAISNIEDGD